MSAYTKNPNLTADEAAAAWAGGEDGGQYLDSIGKFDLRSLSEKEWGEFCGRVFAGACADLRRRADDTIPF